MKEIVEKINLLFNIDVLELMAEYQNFIEQSYPILDKYYEGQDITSTVGIFNSLVGLQQKFSNLIGLLNREKNSFSDFQSWDFLSLLEDNYTKLQTIGNLARWKRSTISTGKYESGTVLKYVVRQNQSIEKTSKDNFSITDYDNQWQDLAIKNDLKEEDYTNQGGYLLKSTALEDSTIEINSVIDSIIGKSIYGKDINRKLTFSNQDLLALDYDETLEQSVDILSNLKKNDNPEFSDVGLEPGLVAGSNINSIAYPSIFRQITNTFTTDDSIKAILIKDIRVEGDSIFLYTEIVTKLNDILKKDLRI